MENMVINSSETNSSNSKLDGLSNWSIWKFQVKVILKALEVYGIVDGSVVKPEEDADKEIWEKKDAKAQSVIVTRLSQKVMLQVMNCETSKDIWDKLHTIYEQTSEMSLHLLQQKFFSMQHNQNEDMATFIAKIEETVNQIRQLKGEVPEKMVLTKIITSLPDNYKHFVSAWESVTSENQKLSELVARLLIEEQRITNKQEVTALVASQKVENRKCFKCNKVGHYKKDCRSNTNNKFCDNCKKKGHCKKDCWFLNKKKNSEASSNAFTAKSAAFHGHVVINDWIVDSGASEHMCYSKELFCKYEKLSQIKNIMIGDGTMIQGIGIGQIKLKAFNGKCWVETTLNNVLHVPKMTANLFSVGAAITKGYEVKMNYDQCMFIKNNVVSAVAKRDGKIYKMCFKNIETVSCANIGTVSENLIEWHCKMVHQNIDQVKNILNRNDIQYNSGADSICVPCIKGKQHKLSYNLSETKTEKPGQLIHMDLCGPMETDSLGGARYFLLIKDDYSRYRVVYFIKNKSETENKIYEFIMRTKTNPGHTIQTIRTDNGSEFINSKVKQIMINNGIQHQTSVAFTPQQNGCAEREIRTIVEAARTMILEKNYNKNLWAEAVNTAVFVLNRTGQSRVKNKTPFEIWFDKGMYDIHNLRIFGSKVAVHIPDQKRKKWDPKSEIGIFLGYGEDTKGFRIYFPNKNKVEIKRDVIFIENAQKCDKIPTQKNNEEIVQDILLENIDFEEEIDVEENNISTNSRQHGEGTQTEFDENATETDADKNVTENILEDNIITNSRQDGEDTQTEVDENTTETSRDKNSTENKRMRRQPRWLNDYETNFEDCNDPETNFLSINNEPNSYEEALQRDDKENWLKAIEKEIKTLKENNTWTEVKECPKDVEIVSSKWVFKIKEDLEGGKQYKARLVARGFEQTSCDSEIYAPVARLTTFRLFMIIANKMKLPVHQLDVTGAFLYGDIDETVYMKLPDGTKCKLNRSIYGLKKSPKYWNKKFDTFMRNEKFDRSKNDLCLYTRWHNGKSLFLLIYVDDLLIFGNDENEIENFKLLLNHNFKTKYLGLASNYLGISIKQDTNKGITVINQQKYLEKVLGKFGMSDCKGADTPIDQNFDFRTLQREKSESELIEKQCRQLIGSLLYAVSGTRPDLCVSVIFLSRYQHCASTALYKALKRILRYIKSTLNLSLIYTCNLESELKGFVDADWAGDTRDRKSTSGYILTLHDCIISWLSKKQIAVALSSSEAEYIALSIVITEAFYLKKLISDFMLLLKDPILIFEDNQSVIKISENNENNKRLKHVDIRYNYILDNVNKGEVQLEYVPTSENIADMFTKPLGKILFQKFRDCMLK